MEREAWALYDTRTGKRVSNLSYATAERAGAHVDRLRKRNRPNIRQLLPYLRFIQLTDATYGSNAGDIIDGRDTA
jgi:hypothetical protein